MLTAKELIQRIGGCSLNNREGQKKIYQTFYGYAISICSRYTNKQGDAVEILNDGFLKIFKEIHRFTLLILMSQVLSKDWNVIEVPLALSYIFRRQSKQAWFVSSYFMKKETYKYHSKIAPGQYQDKIYTINNQNEHYLSSFRLSSGYEKKFNKTISLSAEPYLNLPLSGIGFGKVKLNSAGLLFSLSVKPFAKN